MRKQILFLVIPVLLVLTVLLGGGQALAQGPAGNGPQAGLGPAFTYQGQLKDSSGNPITNTCDFRFSLWDALSGGFQVGGNCTVSGVAVANGYFAAQVNGGGEFGANAFTGDARWLEIAVQCAGDPGYTTLSPRQELTAAPYALSLLPGARVVGAVSGGYMSALTVENTDTSAATTGLQAYAHSTSGIGVFGFATATSGFTYGVYGLSASTAGTGVLGNATADSGVTAGVWGSARSTSGTGVYGVDYATTGSTYGVRGVSQSTAGIGVFGWTNAISGTTYGVYGMASSPDGTGVYGSGGAYGVQGLSEATSGEAYGVFGQGIIGVGGVSYATDGTAVFGANYAASGQTYGVYGTASSPIGTGVYGSGGNYGVEAYANATSGDTMAVRAIAVSPDGIGVYASASAASGQTYGVFGHAVSPDGTGICGDGGAYGVRGYSSGTSGKTYGVYGESASPAGYGVYGKAAMTGTVGIATATSGAARGVYGRSDSSGAGAAGVYGYNPLGIALYGLGPNAVVGDSSSPNYGAVVGRNFATTGTGMGVYGSSASTQGYGVYGYASATTGTARGVAGVADGPGVDGGFPQYSVGVYGRATTTSGYGAGVWGSSSSPNGVGVYGVNSSGYAGFFLGDVHVIGDLSATGAKSFKIDNPLDPAHQYLYHYSMESSEVLNQYSGNATLDGNGEAWVELPDWFAAINKDFRYQLTPVGAPAPGLYIAQEVQSTEGGSRFQIAGGPAGLKVSWQVTALRNDPYIRTYGAPVVEDKPADKQGTYLQPELYGQPVSAAEGYSRWPAEIKAAPSPAPAPAAQPR